MQSRALKAAYAVHRPDGDSASKRMSTLFRLFLVWKGPARLPRYDILYYGRGCFGQPNPGAKPLRSALDLVLKGLHVRCRTFGAEPLGRTTKTPEDLD